MSQIQRWQQVNEKNISREEIQLLELFDVYKKRQDIDYCNLILVPTNIGTIFKEKMFGEQGANSCFTMRKDGTYRRNSCEGELLTKVVGYEIESTKSVEEIFLENIGLEIKEDSIPLFSEYGIRLRCNDYWDNYESMSKKFPLFYSEILEQIDPNPQIYDWNLLGKNYSNRVKELGFAQDNREIKELEKQILRLN